MRLQLKWPVNLSLIFVLLGCHAAFPQVWQNDLTKLNLEDLMNLEFMDLLPTSVSSLAKRSVYAKLTWWL